MIGSVGAVCTPVKGSSSEARSTPYTPHRLTLTQHVLLDLKELIDLTAGEKPVAFNKRQEKLRVRILVFLNVNRDKSVYEKIMDEANAEFLLLKQESHFLRMVYDFLGDVERTGRVTLDIDSINEMWNVCERNGIETWEASVEGHSGFTAEIDSLGFEISSLKVKSRNPEEEVLLTKLDVKRKDLKSERQQEVGEAKKKFESFLQEKKDEMTQLCNDLMQSETDVAELKQSYDEKECSCNDRLNTLQERIGDFSQARHEAEIHVKTSSAIRPETVPPQADEVINFDKKSHDNKNILDLAIESGDTKIIRMAVLNIQNQSEVSAARATLSKIYFEGVVRDSNALLLLVHAGFFSDQTFNEKVNSSTSSALNVQMALAAESPDSEPIQPTESFPGLFERDSQGKYRLTPALINPALVTPINNFKSDEEYLWMTDLLRAHFFPNPSAEQSEPIPSEVWCALQKRKAETERYEKLTRLLAKAWQYVLDNYSLDPEKYQKKLEKIMSRLPDLAKDTSKNAHTQVENLVDELLDSTSDNPLYEHRKQHCGPKKTETQKLLLGIRRTSAQSTFFSSVNPIIPPTEDVQLSKADFDKLISAEIRSDEAQKRAIYVGRLFKGTLAYLSQPASWRNFYRDNSVKHALMKKVLDRYILGEISIQNLISFLKSNPDTNNITKIVGTHRVIRPARSRTHKMLLRDLTQENERKRPFEECPSLKLTTATLSA